MGAATDASDDRDPGRDPDSGRDDDPGASELPTGSELRDEGLLPPEPRRGVGGVRGSILGAAMLGLDQAINGRKPREEAPIIVDANGEPIDLDVDGFELDVDAETSIVSPPQPRSAPVVSARSRRPARRRR